jgi:tRNA-dihydrouridine synthase B
MRIGPHTIEPPVVLAPMAGVTDKPFRQLCRRLGAGLTVSEMTASDPRLWHTRKSRLRMDHAGEPAPVSVQIAGYDPAMLAEAARHNVDLGAAIIDINMGCPAKKVCNVAAGSALLKDEALVGRILEAVTALRWTRV